jgi:signal transduction histidine kinase
MNKFKISGGILPLFRIFIGIRLIWSVFEALTMLGKEEPLEVFTIPLILSLSEGLFLLAYLYCPRLEKVFGSFYLPLGLAVATLGPFIDNTLIFLAVPSFLERFSFLSGSEKIIIYTLLFMITQMQLVFIILIPLIMVSWQYKLKWVFVYCVGVTLLNFLQIFLPSHSLGRPIWSVPVALLPQTILLAFTGYVVNRLAFEQKEVNRQLSQHAMTLDHLATSRERNRLAREIHDTLAHTLSGLAVNLEAVMALWDKDPGRAKKIVQHSLLVTRDGLIETRRSIQALRAGPLDDLGLLLALKQLAISSAERYSLKLELDLPEKQVDLEPAVEQTVYRIAEEAIHNACQHAQASRLSMGLQVEEERLTFTLVDDGKGFNVVSTGREEQFGLKGMYERSEAVGGLLSVDSQPGMGTSLKLVVERQQK